MIKKKTFQKQSDIEKRWQGKWRESKLFNAKIGQGKKIFFNLWMFPYPSAEGLHAGHAFSSTGSDVYGRFMRMAGYEVFQPIGYDSFGIHSENFALKIKDHPKNMIERTTKYYEKQLKSLGHGYDWGRTVTTSKPDYYKWTQWLFIEMFKAGLAYRKKAEVNWCPSCKTVLADEQVIQDHCERCGHKVELRELEQWFFRITDYADRLLANLEKIDWPEHIKIAQRNWIGKSQGATVKFVLKVPGKKKGKHSVEVFTTRPDTLYGTTFIAVSPKLAKSWQDVGWKAPANVSKYIKDKLKKSKKNIERDKSGVLTDVVAINPVNGEEVPVFVADYVLVEYGTGAIMGVPAHDFRDWEFAKKHRLEIRQVISGGNTKKEAYDGDGKIVNSGSWNGIKVPAGIPKVIDDVGKNSWGKKTTSYHLRDWLISRQRYWGPPIPMIFCEVCAKKGRSYLSSAKKGLLHKNHSDWDHLGWWPARKLPVELPFMDNYQPKGTGRGPLAGNSKFYKVKCPDCGSIAKRETDVSDTFLDSSWYFLRYPSVSDARADKEPFNAHITSKWLPVNLYFGGAEHAVLHLMYARFVTQALHDLNYLKFEEPFPKFFAHGLMIKEGAKMSKSKGNVVNPDSYIEKFGADTLRLYLMFMGPMDGYPDFRDTGIEGMKRFVDRVWDLFQNYSDVILTDKKNCEEILIKMHQTIKKVTEDIQNFHYNTAISAIMEFVNLLRENVASESKRVEKLRCAEWDEAMRTLAKLIAPFAPHTAEEVWVNVLHEKYSIQTSTWPQFVPELIKEDTLTIAVQVNGKLRATLTISEKESANEDKVVRLAKANSRIKKWLKGKKIKSSVFVKGKLVNFVTQ